MERLREALTDGEHHRRQHRRRRVRRSSGSKACRRIRTRRSARRPTRSSRTSIASSGVDGTYTFTMRPNVQVDAARRSGRAGAPDDRAARERARRHRAEHRAAGQRAAIRSWCSCPASPTSNRAKEIIRSTGLLELKIVEQGPSATREALLVERPGAAGHGNRAGRQRRRRRRGTVYYLVRKVAGGHRHATCATRGRRSTRTTGRPSASR